MVQMLLVINIGMFLLQLYTGSIGLIETLALWPLDPGASFVFDQARPGFQLWQLLSYSFLHGNLMHLLLNMYALWLFGSRLETRWGLFNFTLYYFVCVLGAALVQLVVAGQSAAQGEVYPTIGASGGVFGLLLAYGLTFPRERLMLIFPPVVLQARWFVLIYGIIELWFGITGTAAGVAHFAHLGGMLSGFIVLWYWYRNPPGYH
ncbi:MAG: rhomboid family intramembrane serine protease [Desulfovermiculus sp.]